MKVKEKVFIQHRLGAGFITNSSEETQKLGKEFARSLLAALQGETLIIALYGDLGSGKTTFIQGLAVGLRIKNRIISPTFVIVRQYKVPPPRSPSGHLGGGEATTSTPARCNTFYHIDLYRIENERDMDSLGIEEIINNKNNIVAIEWAERLKSLMPAKRIDIKFFYEKANARRITFSLTT